MSENNPSPAAATEPSNKAKHTGIKRLALMVVVPALAIIGGIAVYLQGGRVVETDNAYVKADQVQVSPQVNGNIVHVYVHENQHVKQGDVLFDIDPEPYQVEMDKAAANLAQVRTDLSALKASYTEKQAELELAQSRFAFAKNEEKRQTELLGKHYISGADYDAAHQNVDIARLQIQAVKEDLKRIAMSLGGSENTPVDQHPNYQAAKANLAEAMLNFKRTRVLAPQDGIVRIPPKTGQYFGAGSQAMTMVIDNHLWVEANYTETALTYVVPGQSVTIKVDTYPDREWKGVVESLSPATSAEFSVLPAQNVTGNWVKIAQRLPVRIRLDATDDAPQLRAGLSVIAEIDTGHQRSLMGITL